MRTLLLLAALVQDDVADVAVEERAAKGDADKSYFLIRARPDAPMPEKGWGLVLVLPGGDGGAAFQPFVKRIAKHAVPDGLLVAQMVAREWTPGQFSKVVWPTAMLKADGMKFGTEEFADAVVEDVGARLKLDATRIYTLSWSSGGPAAYAIAARKKTPVVGSFVAMSAFPLTWVDFADVKGRSFYLHQSREDQVTPFAHAEAAKKFLAQKGARIELSEYAGGHGWRGPVFADLRKGLEWLEKLPVKTSDPSPPSDSLPQGERFAPRG